MTMAYREGIDRCTLFWLDGSNVGVRARRNWNMLEIVNATSYRNTVFANGTVKFKNLTDSTPINFDTMSLYEGLGAPLEEHPDLHMPLFNTKPIGILNGIMSLIPDDNVTGVWITPVMLGAMDFTFDVNYPALVPIRCGIPP